MDLKTLDAWLNGFISLPSFVLLYTSTRPRSALIRIEWREKVPGILTSPERTEAIPAEESLTWASQVECHMPESEAWKIQCTPERTIPQA